MVEIKIWGIAQAIFAAICCVSFGIGAAIIVPFAVVGGIPALLLYIVWLTIAQRLSISEKAVLGWSLLIMPVCTGLCSLCMAYTLDRYDHELFTLGLEAIPATFVSVLICYRDILRFKTSKAL